jgi:uncharacterized protein YukE
MNAIFAVLVGAIVTGVVGNFLVQRWQLRSWREQQRQLGYQAELQELKSLLGEISTKAADRHNAMRRLVGSLAPQSRAETGAALADYQQQVTIWNATLNSFYVRIRLAVDYAATLRFEHDVHNSFVEAGRSIEDVLRLRADGDKPNWSDLIDPKDRLNGLQGKLFSFLRDLTDEIERRREEIYFGKKLPYTVENLGEYTTLELIKAFFTADIDSFYVIRTA